MTNTLQNRDLLAAPQENCGFFYKVHDSLHNNKLVGYLLGTIHLIPPDCESMLQLNQSIVTAFNNSIAFLPEINLCNPALQVHLPSMMNDIGEAAKAKISKEYGKNTWKQHFKCCEELVPLKSLDIFLTQKAVEKYLQNNNVRIYDLETTQDHMEAAKDDVLIHASNPIRSVEEKMSQLRSLCHAWQSGNLEAIPDYPNVTLMDCRNKKMCDGIINIGRNVLKNNNTFFAYVGAMHLKGEGNLLEHLKREGFTVEPGNSTLSSESLCKYLIDRIMKIFI